MNVAKNLALTIILIALTLKEQMIIPVEKTLNNAGHIDAKIESILAKWEKKNPAKSPVFYWLFLGEVSSRNFPWNRPIFQRILTFFPRKSREIGRFFRKFVPENLVKFWFFFWRNIRSPVCGYCEWHSQPNKWFIFNYYIQTSLLP